MHDSNFSMLPALQAPDSQPTVISTRSVAVALAVERYVLPWGYFWFAYRQIELMRVTSAKYHLAIQMGMPHLPQTLFLASITRAVLLTILSLFMAITLFVSRRPTHPPKRLIQLTVPLAMSYYFFLFGAVSLLPRYLNDNRMPLDWQVLAAVAAVGITIVGYTISIWGLCSLGRSFAILVAARRLVTRGPYAYVRHPMYLGYIFELLGLLLSSFSLGMLGLALGFLLLMVTRARLEEELLAEADPAYRQYMKHTGFLFPRFGQKPATADS